jgi:hypothetical protein
MSLYTHRQGASGRKFSPGLSATNYPWLVECNVCWTVSIRAVLAGRACIALPQSAAGAIDCWRPWLQQPSSAPGHSAASAFGWGLRPMPRALQRSLVHRKGRRRW